MRPCSLFLVLLAMLCVPGAVSAQTAKPEKTSPPAPLTSSKAQADAIAARVVENLWEYSDKYFHDGDYNRVIGLCRVMVEIDPSFDEAYENAAYLLWSQQDPDAADVFLRYGLTRSKNQLSLLFEFGRHLMTTKRPDAALPYLKQAAAIPNAGPLVYSQLAHCYEKLHKYEDAVATWSKLVKTYPTFGSGPVNLARAKKLLSDTR